MENKLEDLVSRRLPSSFLRFLRFLRVLLTDQVTHEGGNSWGYVDDDDDDADDDAVFICWYEYILRLRIRRDALGAILI